MSQDFLSQEEVDCLLKGVTGPGIEEEEWHSKPEPSNTMSNTELSEAIRYAWDRCEQRYVGGYDTRTTEAGKVMLVHLKDLLAVQKARAEK